MRIDPIELSRELISFNTINPPGNELSCILHLERILAGAGLETSLQEFAPGRANLIAWIGAVGKLPLCFTGHIDTVPLVSVCRRAALRASWQHRDRLWRRGSDGYAMDFHLLTDALQVLVVARHRA